MGKRTLLAAMALVCVVLMMTGCTALQKLKGRGGKKQPTVQGAYASVPEKLKKPVQNAIAYRSQAKSNLSLAKKQVVLANLIKEHGSLKKKYAELNEKYASTEVKRAEVSIERRKQEAIDNANYGNRLDNIKKIASLRTKELEIESDAIKIKADMDALDLSIKTMEKKIDAQSNRVAHHK